MIIDLARDEAPTDVPDVLIIGAGAVGITLAVDLARKGKRVVVCESGGRGMELASQKLNEAILSGRMHSGITEGRARVLGGTTTLWGGQLIAFREIDFVERPWLNLKAWPIDRRQLLPYYEAFADMAGLPNNGSSEEEIWRTLKLSQPGLGEDIELILTRWLREPNLARLFAKDITESPNLIVLLHASATGFTANTGGQIIGTTVRSPDGKTVEMVAKNIVVATGTIEASRLMLASAQADTSLPWADNPLVGTAFQDHLDLRVASVEPIDHKRFNDAFDNIYLKGFKYNPKLALASHIQAARKLTNVGAVFTFESSLTAHLSNIKIFLRSLRNGKIPREITAIPAALLALVEVWRPLVIRYLKDNRAFNPADIGIGLRVHCEQRPLRSSQISLAPSRRDANGVPVAMLNWLVDGNEIEAIASFCEILAPQLQDSGLARLTIDPRILARDTSILDEARDTNHHCGGLQMGANRSEGVVDPNLRVYGTTNLYVAGAAVFPSSSFANPTFTALALALRLSDHLRGELE